MTRFYGARQDLASLIRTHLFIICPNNSGSTFLQKILSTSSHTWNLESEGQLTFGFAGPNPRKNKTGSLWASQQRWIDMYTDAGAYNWPIIREAWYFQAFSRNPQAKIFVTKSPPFLLSVAELQHHFENAKFLFMVRNPYAAVEGNFRRLGPQPLRSGVDSLEAAATHIVNCFRYQQRNIETYRDCGVFFTYEAMCDEPGRIEQYIQTLVPELDDLVLQQKVPVKYIYDEMLRNMNDQQLARISMDDVGRINRVFEHHQELLDYFGYSLLQ